MGNQKHSLMVGGNEDNDLLQDLVIENVYDDGIRIAELNDGSLFFISECEHCGRYVLYPTISHNCPAEDPTATNPAELAIHQLFCEMLIEIHRMCDFYDI